MRPRANCEGGVAPDFESVFRECLFLYTCIYTLMKNSYSRFRRLRTSKSKYCVDVHSGSTRSNAPLISYRCHKGPNQRFAYNKRTKQLIAQHSKKCLDILGRQIVQTRCNPRKTSQKWNYTHKQWVSSKNTTRKLCMDVMGGQYANGSLSVSSGKKSTIPLILPKTVPCLLLYQSVGLI